MSTKSLKWSFLFLGIWTLAVHFSLVNSQCQRPKDIYKVLETDPKGSLILSVPATDGYTWRYVIYNAKYSPIKNYLKFFKHNDRYDMTLSRPLDLEELRDKYKLKEASYSIRMYCNGPSKRELEYGIVLIIIAVNEHPPRFNTSNINVYVNETSKSVTVIKLIDWASDEDQNPLNREIKLIYFGPPFNPFLGMRRYTGSVYTRSPLDYESLPENFKYLKAGVRVRDTGGLVGTATLTIHVLDADDLPPKFTYTGCPEPCDSVLYTAEVDAFAIGRLTRIEPAPIYAEDGDDLGSSVTYKMTQGPQNIFDYVSMDPVTAEVAIQKQLIGLQISQIVILIEAQENTLAKRRSKCTSLLISVLSGSPHAALHTREPRQANAFIVGAVLASIIFFIIVILVVILVFR